MKKPASASPAAGPISIRRAAPADLDAIMAIEIASFAAPWPRGAMLDEIAKHAWSIVEVAERGDAIAGFAVYWVVADERHLQNLAVAVAARRAGVGDALVRHVVAEAVRGGARYVVLEVRASNEAAKRLYAGFGFRAIGRRKGYYQDSGEDAIVMALELDEGGGGR
jgi:ribosomal-protein-alanine N-acetyltransferase